MTDLRDSVSRWGLIRLCYGRLMTLVRPWLMLARINIRPLGIHGGSVEPGKSTSPRIANREEMQKASEGFVESHNFAPSRGVADWAIPVLA
jgi:hypothetical protein